MQPINLFLDKSIHSERRKVKMSFPAYKLTCRHKYMPESLKHHDQPDPSVNILINKHSVSLNKSPFIFFFPSFLLSLSPLVVSPCTHYTIIRLVAQGTRANISVAVIL